MICDTCRYQGYCKACITNEYECKHYYEMPNKKELFKEFRKNIYAELERSCNKEINKLNIKLALYRLHSSIKEYFRSLKIKKEQDKKINKGEVK